MANIKQDILDTVHKIYMSQAVTNVAGTYEADSTGTLTFTFSDSSVITVPFKYTGVELNNFVEELMKAGANVIFKYREQFNPPLPKQAFFTNVTE